MRMWCVPPELMCRQHLLGEHVESHMILGSLRKGKNLGKFLKGLVDPSRLYDRHKELVAEMDRRGYNHQSPILKADAEFKKSGYVFAVEHNLKDLADRCEACRKLQGQKL